MGNPSSGIAVRLDVVVAGYCSHDVQVTIVRVEIVKATFKYCPCANNCLVLAIAYSTAVFP